MQAVIHSDGQWQARLSLQYQRTGQRTVLAKRSHQGPLLVQRPFYPEQGVCHSYIIHPPGGVVGGDVLDIEVDVKDNAHALITTPASGKFYNSDGRTAQLNQTMTVADGAILEWLPQDNIFFEGSRTRLHSQIDLSAQAQFIGWEMNCLGRPFSDRPFDQGYCEQKLQLRRDGMPLLIDRNVIDATGPVMQQQWGLAGHSVTATMLATSGSAELLSALQRDFTVVENGRIGFTLINDVLICRLLCHHGEQARLLFEQIWQRVRPELIGIAPCSPRIWRT